MATEIEVTFAKSQSLPDTVPEGRLQVVDESAGATEVEAYVGTQNGVKKITDKDKANIADLESGELVPKLAENLTPFAEDSGTTQTQPFFLEGTATGNGESRVDAKQVPAYAFLQEKRGNMVTVNQRIQSFDEVGYMSGQWTFPTVDWATVNRTADSITYTVTSVPSEQFVNIATCWGSPAVGHTYLALCDISSNSTGSWFARTFVCNVPQWTNSKCYVVTPSSSSSNYFQFTLQSSGLSIGDIITIKNPKLVDLTQWFNGNIPAYLLSHPEAFGRYYKGSLAYEPGRLESATGRYFESEGRNIWDEEWEVGAINSATGSNYDANTQRIRSKNYDICTPSTNYYLYGDVAICWYDINKNIISTFFPNSSKITLSPQNAAYFRIYTLTNVQNPTYNYDITISRYYEGESGYGQYYPHEVLANIDTGTEQLGAFDYKVPSGLITRSTRNVDLGTLKFYLNSGTYPSHSFFSLSVSDIKSGSVLLCADTTIINRASNNLGLYTSGNAIIVVTNADYNSEQELKDALSGIIAHYELATPTTEQGTPFQETVPIDDFGQLSWSDTDVPQGNQIFYPVDYKAAIDTLINYTDGDMTSLVRKTDYASSSQGGVVKVGAGVSVNNAGQLNTYQAPLVQIKAGENQYNVIASQRQHQSVFYGLARAAGVNLASSTEETAPDGTNPGVYPAAAIQAILKMLFPAAPTTDGTYDLVCTVTNGQPVYSWVVRT